jgi:diguanylate cyclase (GGDEF)-like protein
VPTTDAVGMDALTAFLCRDGTDRGRLLELERPLRRARLLSYGGCAIALLVMGPWVGWWPIGMLALLGGAYELLIRRRLQRSARPAVLVAVGFVLTVAIIGVTAALTGGPASPLIAWLVIPIVSLAGRFDTRGVWGGAGVVLVALAAICAVHPHAFADDPVYVIAVVPLTLAVGWFSAAMMWAERRSRTQSSLDDLTGLLNRRSLPERFGELAEQARLTGDAVALVALDLDHFKRINDTHGHARGDAVLREVAAAIRGELRSFELAYRIGGEEFLIVLPGVDLEHGAGVAERLRVRIAALRPDGLEVSASLGVSAGAGDEVAYGPLFDAADRALYAAKHNGRDRVETAAPDLARVPAAVG